MRRSLPNLPTLALAAVAAMLFGWLATLGSGCGPGLFAVEVTATPTGSGVPTGTPTPGKLSGDILIAGGIDATNNAVATAEIYDPNTQTFADTGAMNKARAFHTATQLNNGAILIAGGQTPGGTPLNTAEIYNESTEAFRLLAGKMVAARTLHTATLLNNGWVLITGGAGANNVPLDTAELYNPSTGTFTATKGNMNFKRAAHTATLLGSGQVLIAGGYSDSKQTTVQNTAELYDPSTQTFTNITALMRDARYFDQAQIFPGGAPLSGEVLLAGGHDNNVVTATAEVYNPTSNAFSSVSTMTSTRMQFASAIVQIAGNTMVLLCGGMTNASTITATAELFNPTSLTFGPTGNMTDSRRFETATAFISGPLAGEVLVTGGQDAIGVSNTVNTAELYSSTFLTFSATAPMANARYGHTAIVLP
jgi:hypothetical protein